MPELCSEVEQSAVALEHKRWMKVHEGISGGMLA